jgi:hypothetical protein
LTNPKPRVRAKSKPDPKFKSGLERDYADFLETLYKQGQIQYWSYEPIRLRMGDATGYNPDFFVISSDGEPQFHETKGFMRPNARTKLYTCAEQYWMFCFYLVTRNKKKEWHWEKLN